MPAETQQSLLGRFCGRNWVHNQKGRRGGECGCLARFLLFSVLASFPRCGAASIQGISPQSNLSGNSYRDQRCVCMMILSSIKLNVMINHHGYQIKKKSRLNTFEGERGHERGRRKGPHTPISRSGKL